MPVQSQNSHYEARMTFLRAFRGELVTESVITAAPAAGSGVAPATTDGRDRGLLPRYCLLNYRLLTGSGAETSITGAQERIGGADCNESVVLLS